MFGVRVQTQAIAPAPVTEGAAGRCGAEVRFVGKVRNDAKSSALSHLVLEHFPGVTEAEIERIIGQARERWSLQKAWVVHRVGRINVGEDIVMVETASAHRRDAYQANVFIMDYLKTQAPFWKQECFTDGSSHWVEARDSDQHAAQRWQAGNSKAGADSLEGLGAAAPRPGKPRIGALILAGGEGRRMGYRNKGLQHFRGRPLVQHVADTLRPQVDYLAISANQDLADYAALGLPVFPDVDWPLNVGGPLAGIISAFPQFPDDLDAMLVVPCDCPLLPADLAPRLAQALFTADGPRAVVASAGGAPQYSVSMFRPGVLLGLIPHLHGTADRSLRGWLAACGYAEVGFEDAGAFVNINDLESLQSLQA